MTNPEQTAVADLNGLLAALGVSSVDEALERIEAFQDTEKMLIWLTKADAELSRNWDEWRVLYGKMLYYNCHHQSQDDDWTCTSYYRDAKTALMTAYNQFKKENPNE